MQKNVETIEKIIQYINEKPTIELRTVDMMDRIGEFIEVSKMIQKETTRDKIEECLEKVLISEATFDSNFKQRVRVGLPTF